MLSMQLKQAATATGGRLIGDDIAFAAVSTDSRSLQGSPLFIALRGDRFDGHDYLEQACTAGASALMVEKESAVELPQLLVDDCRLALGRLAAVWRGGSEVAVVALTGSNGKTTLKEMLHSILSRNGTPVLSTRGNLNNDIGLPLTLLRIKDEPLAVVEMGANHPGEIDYLTHLAKPDVAVLNNAGRAHLEGFGSLEGVARAKAEIVNGLADDGWFVYHADSRWAPLWRELARGRRTIGFGITDRAEVRSPSGMMETHWSENGFESRFSVQTPSATFEVGMRLAGEHNRMNALAAVAAAHCLGIPEQAIRQGLSEMTPVKGRLQYRRVGEAHLVDDSYNANPESMNAAIDVLKSAPGRHFLVLGDMAELGIDAGRMHAEIGERAKAAGIDGLYAVGPLSASAVQAFGQGGRHFDDQTELAERLQAMLESGDTVLVKGSRGAAMDRVVEILATEGEMACC